MPPSTPIQTLLQTARTVLTKEPQQALEQARLAYAQSQGAEAAQAQMLMGMALHQLRRDLEAIPVLESVVRSLHTFDKASELQTLTLLVRLYRERGDLGEASNLLQTAVRLARELGQPDQQAVLLNQQAAVYHAQAEHAKALECLGQALEICRGLGLYLEQAKYLSNVGTLLTTLGDYPKALEHYLQAYKILSEHPDGQANLAVTLGSVGNLYSEMGEPATALEHFERGLEIARQLGDLKTEAMLLLSTAETQRGLGQLELAKAHILRTLMLAKEHTWEPLLLEALEELGQTETQMGEHQAAVKVHLEALERARVLGQRMTELEILLSLAQDYLNLDLLEPAEAALRQALELAEQSQQKRSEYCAHQLLAELCQRRKEWQRAVFHLTAYHRLEREVFNAESDRKQRMLSAVLGLERARAEAEAARVRRDLEAQARAKAEAEVADRTEDLEQARLEVVARLALAAEYRDDVTGDHTWRVGRNAALIARELGWDDESVEQLRLAARLHDVGKIGISDLILLKPAKLEREEFEVMKTHTTIGARILSGGHSRLLQMAERIAHSHHERWDGQGYPRGLAGAEIPLEGRIVAVADVLDALTHDRPYKQAWPLDHALAEIARGAGTQFDPMVVDVAMQVFSRSTPHELDQLDRSLEGERQLERRLLGIEQG
ncbi:MAG: tetratricopeptide repeat protein [Meiothermus sp.]|nr:tetratricopeptide repeat protein [Meiothermus sp.]